MDLVKIIKLKLLKRLYRQGNYLKVGEKILKYNLTDKSMEYIWYCPRQSCQSIVIKTKQPFLKKGTFWKCKRCGVMHTVKELVNHNKRNIKIYLDIMNKV